MTEFSTEELKSMSDKDSKRPEYRKLYERLPYLEAYARHTDMRIAKDGPKLAIGAKQDGLQDWDAHGQQQLGFLQYAGMMPKHSLLDLGCGTGRLACKAIPYLDDNKYVGIDISADAIKHCEAMVKKAGFIAKTPVFILGDGSLTKVKLFRFDYILAHSVFTHLPPDVIEQIFRALSIMDFGQFYFTHKTFTENKRVGLKQFLYDPNWFKQIAHPHGIRVEPARCEFPAGQHVMKAWRK